MKFGGASLGSVGKILHVSQVIKEHAKDEKVVVVVSAFLGVTDRLVSIFQNYKQNRFDTGLKLLQYLYDYHFAILSDLQNKQGKQFFSSQDLSHVFGQLSAYLTFHREYDKESFDHIVSFGERISSFFIASALQSHGVLAKSIESSRIIVTNDEFNNAKAVIADTRDRVERVILPLLVRGILPVVTGYFGATKKGQTTTFGRGGSDYSATVLAHVLDASEVILWKEVDGVFSKDPKKDEGAEFLPEISYQKAAQMAKQGAKVLHPDAMEPVVEKKITVWVKNIFRPELIGTKIWEGGI